MHLPGALLVSPNIGKCVLSWALARTGSVLFTHLAAALSQTLARWSNILPILFGKKRLNHLEFKRNITFICVKLLFYCVNTSYLMEN